MKISEYIEKMSEWESDDREKYLRPLVALLSPVSAKSLMQNQAEHFAKSEADYPAFVESQNREIIKCLELEVAEIGSIVRAELGMEPMTLDTDVAIPGN